VADVLIALLEEDGETLMKVSMKLPVPLNAKELSKRVVQRFR